ncbi:MAG TPA: glycosyl transferase family 2 [Nitrospiria bacterium]|nr:glycosyl transferase family 2 [Nitrospiria bacterium]
MRSESGALREGLEGRIREIGPADVLVGIPSYNNSRTISRVVQAVSAGLAKYFPDAKAVLVNSDGGSTDGTPEAVAGAGVDMQSILISHRVNPLQKITTPYHGIPGKGSAFRLIFELARALDVKACAVVDSDLRSITPEWMELLLRPILKEGFEYVAPYYQRHKYDGTITNSIVYPLTRALYGKRIRQPIGGEFGFSGELAGHFLSKDVWGTDVARYGIDVWMTTTAIARNSRICQAYLGAKIHDPKDPGADLSAMLAQVVGSLFSLMEEHAALWKSIVKSEPVPLFGFQYDVGLEPIAVNVDRMVGAFQLGVREFAPLWEGVLPAEDLVALKEMSRPAVPLALPESVWVRIVYDFALAAHRQMMSREHLLKSLTPLYLGRVASFIRETQESGHHEVEEKIEQLCQAFERDKPYLIERWEPSANTGAPI